MQFNTYQAIAITDGSQSYAVYTYRCGDLQWSGGATIGFNGGPVGNLYANHPLSGGIASSSACVNTGITEWSNVVYNVSIDSFIATEPPPTIEPRMYIKLSILHFWWEINFLLATEHTSTKPEYSLGTNVWLVYVQAFSVCYSRLYSE